MNTIFFLYIYFSFETEENNTTTITSTASETSQTPSFLKKLTTADNEGKSNLAMKIK